MIIVFCEWCGQALKGEAAECGHTLLPYCSPEHRNAACAECFAESQDNA